MGFTEKSESRIPAVERDPKIEGISEKQNGSKLKSTLPLMEVLVMAKEEARPTQKVDIVFGQGL